MNCLRCLAIGAAFALFVPIPAFDVTAKSAIAIDGASGKVLWSKNADAPMYPASTTKIMTALLLIERCKPNDVIVAPPDIQNVKESSMHLKPGERVTAHDMLYAMMLRSANDGCYAVAMHISGSVPAFSQLMNERAKKLGCTHTHFDNPNGLNDPLHTTTAHDLALIARAAMRHPEFREAVKTYKYEISRSINQHDCTMVNHDKLLKIDPSIEGIKTGFTNPAGHCFVGSVTRNGFRVITVVMKSAHWQRDDEDLTNWAFTHFEKKQSLAPGSVVGSVQVPGSDVRAVPVALSNEAYTVGPVGKPNPITTQRVVPEPELQAPIKKGQAVGELELTDGDGFLQRTPVVATADVVPSMIAKHAQKGPSGSTIIFGSALLVGAFLVRGRAKKRAKFYGRRSTAR